ncbi:response regulator [Sphingomonas sp. ac-8]|uniref:hybrid sensor histidine kinase/response regulator n=1 Tax=Sphingomonas sp. ac-8 TaxID=3242977 RepID=UPI003A811C18
MARVSSATDGRPPVDRLPFLVSLGVGLVAALLVLRMVGEPVVAAGFLAAALLAPAVLFAWSRFTAPPPAEAPPADWALAHALAEASEEALAVTDRGGQLVCANSRYAERFGGFPTPPALPIEDEGASQLAAAGRTAWRDGRASTWVRRDGTAVQVAIERIGDGTLVWRFFGGGRTAASIEAEQWLAGPQGDRLGSAGIMAALLGSDGRIRAANRVLRTRAMGQDEGPIAGRDFARFLTTDGEGRIRFEREGAAGTPLRLLQVPFLPDEGAPMLVVLLDEETAETAPPIAGGAAGHVRSLVSLLPVGMALVDRDGRFLHMNHAFARATGVNTATPPLYPGDLVVREDKGALADAIRRFAGGAQHASDMAVRLLSHPDEPIALTIGGGRGLGDAAVLLTLKDTGEESRLKRQVAQATKMQAVGQLAGGVAHDFNNILTAIIGHCDLMLMRHTPGDSDYDDIQQIRANSNRAASLTRQLLAFSRQQTLRPQVLQLPDVISEVSNLLKRLLGETVELVVQHGRNLGPVRADPGQLEQVVVNLAVNARDAMVEKHPNGRGRLVIETLAIGAAEVRAMDNEVLPVGDYTAVRMTDNGTGITPEILPKIFEPFFTTKEVGKGTGLGLSTVYGIIKQSGGYIFADSVVGQGTAFTLYLPVHAAPVLAAPMPPAPPRRERPSDIWGTGTILLVEDEDMVRSVAERALTRQGYKVLTAEHGEAALELIADRPQIDLLVSDVVMPAMDGPTMARQVRQIYPDLPILFMSGYAEEQLRRSIDLGNVAFLPKPFSVQQLGEAARDVLATK